VLSDNNRPIRLEGLLKAINLVSSNSLISLSSTAIAFLARRLTRFIYFYKRSLRVQAIRKSSNAFSKALIAASYYLQVSFICA
jgi:hypothetical protein